MAAVFAALLFLSILGFLVASTPIVVTNNYKKEINVKIQGAGVGGCDVILQPGQTNSDCWCLWGTINYSFCAYSKMGASLEDKVSNGRCPLVTGESIVCNDLSSLGNCYDKGYTCTVDSAGFCHCESM